MPQESYYKAALADDDELAELYVGVEVEDRGLPLAGYSVLVQKMDDVLDEIRVLRVEQVNTNPHVRKPAKFRPVRRPVTAAQRLDERLREEKRQSIVAKVLPSGG